MSDPGEATGNAWRPIGRGAPLGVALACAALLGAHFFSADGWVPLIDGANLALHEAGHPIVGLFSNRLMVYGGTLFQLLFPLLVIRQFARQREATGAAAGVVWLGENLLNIARYMADARAHLLPLVGGGEHDWTEIFLRWGVLARDARIAGLTRGLGVLLMIAGVVWLARRYRDQKKEAHE